MQEALLVYLIKQTSLTLPRRDSREIFLPFLLETGVADLYNDQGIFASWAGCENRICVQFTRSIFDTVAVMLD